MRTAAKRGKMEAGNRGVLLPRAVAETSVSQQRSGASPSKRCQCSCPDRPQCRGLMLTILDLGVSDHPSCVLRKKITRSDVDSGQHRLLLPKATVDRPLLEAAMTDAERRRTKEKNGLKVQVLDRLGREYALVLKFVDSIQAYRVMGPDYTRLVTEENGFRVDHYVDLWVFRARRGRGQAQAAAGGELMMAILPYETDIAKTHVPEEEEEEEEEKAAEPPESMRTDEEEDDRQMKSAALILMELKRTALSLLRRIDAGGG